MAMIPAVPELDVTVSIGPLKVSTADSGPIDEIVSVRNFVTVCGLATSPASETRTISAGNSDSTA
jgi:hypothetical protein